MESLLTLFAGLGIGSFLGAFITLCWDKKKFVYKVKLELYSSFIRAYQK